MTVATIDTVVSNVVLMTELDWLLPLEPLARIPGRAIKFYCNPKSGKENEDSAINRKLCQRVRAVMEDLWHRRSTNRELYNYERRLKYQ